MKVQLSALCALAGLWLVAAAPVAEPEGSAPMAEQSSTTTAAPANAETVQALVCSLILDHPDLAHDTFRRQKFDSWTYCRCVAQTSAVCDPPTLYATVAPGSASAVLAQEHASTSAASTQLLHMINAYSIQQTCFFEHLRGKVCAISWPDGDIPSCDCAKERPEEEEKEEQKLSGVAAPAEGGDEESAEQEAIKEEAIATMEELVMEGDAALEEAAEAAAAGAQTGPSDMGGELQQSGDPVGVEDSAEAAAAGAETGPSDMGGELQQSGDAAEVEDGAEAAAAGAETGSSDMGGELQQSGDPVEVEDGGDSLPQEPAEAAEIKETEESASGAEAAEGPAMVPEPGDLTAAASLQGSEVKPDDAGIEADDDTDGDGSED